MNLRTVAQGAPYHLVTQIGECPLECFWVVQLDCGIEVFQSPEDPTLDEPNSWLRLKKFCEDYNTRPANMARANKAQNPYTQINFDPLADGYFYSRRVRKLLCGHPSYNGYQDTAQGFGQLHKDILKIIWELQDGRLEFETRNISDYKKSNLISLIHK